MNPTSTAVFIPMDPRLFRYPYTFVLIFLLYTVIPPSPSLFSAVRLVLIQGCSADEFAALIAITVFVGGMFITGVEALACVCMNSGPIAVIDSRGGSLRARRVIPVI